jgi:hypothetical protein
MYCISGISFHSSMSPSSIFLRIRWVVGSLFLLAKFHLKFFFKKNSRMKWFCKFSMTRNEKKKIVKIVRFLYCQFSQNLFGEVLHCYTTKLNQKTNHGHFCYNKQLLEKYWCWDNFQVPYNLYPLQFLDLKVRKINVHLFNICPLYYCSMWNIFIPF